MFQIFLVMDKADFSLMDDIKLRIKNNKSYENDEIKDLMISLLKILEILKTNFNLIHRDIKPQNILFIK